jgi:hypothetical protein
LTPFHNSKTIDGKLVLEEVGLLDNHKYKNVMDRIRKERQITRFVQDSIDDVVKLVKQIHEKFG